MADEPKIKFGSIVRLKSGGVPMVAGWVPQKWDKNGETYVSYEDRFICMWHDKNGIPHQETYHIGMLELIPASHPYRGDLNGIP